VKILNEIMISNSEHCWLERGCPPSHNAIGY